MVDINYELRKAYFSLLAGNIIINGVTIPVYTYQVPQTTPPISPTNYILINGITSTPFKDDRFNYTRTVFQLMIVTKNYNNNAGAIKDQIAQKIYELIYPYPAVQNVQIVHGYVINTEQQNDVELPGLTDGQQKVINRVISFWHNIQHYPYTTTEGVIYYGTQPTNDTPTDYSNSLNQPGDLPISVDYGNVGQQFFWLAVPAINPLKTIWTDLNAVANAAKMGDDTDLYEIRNITVNTFDYILYITRYPTGFNGYSAQVKYS